MDDRTLNVSPVQNEGTMPLLSSEDWELVDSILDEVLDLPEEERREYLDVACEDKPSIRRQVEVLLAVSRRETVHSFLAPLDQEEGGGGMLHRMNEAWQKEQLEAGQKVGNYTIIRPIGKGGMGIVYLAERTFDAYKKPVALKVVKRGMDTDDIVRRFRFERQILAGLEHANIARLLDGGITEAGLPYFVMEYVQGEPIDKYCDNNRLTIKERLELFKTMCEAVQYAHRNLVVHRDLKPGNVLVTKEGEVKLLDFGIAKVLDTGEPGNTMFMTEAASRRMTPEYAAPEQVRGDQVTTATDVYALGVILYELLCGRRPYRFTTRLITEIEEKICREVPGRPSAMSTRNPQDAEKQALEISTLRGTQPDRLRRFLAGDLDAITLKALKKEPHLRYMSAGDLEKDIDRYLKYQPVQARRDSVRYRFGKFVRRYKLTVAAASVAFLALVGGIITTTWWAKKAQSALVVANDEKNRKEEVNAYYTAMLSRFNPNTTEEYVLARTFMQGGIDRLDELDDQPLMKAVVMNALGEFSRQFKLYGLADSLYQQALDLQRENGRAADHPDLIESLNGIGRVLMFQGRYNEAIPLFNENIKNNPAIVESYLNLGAAYLYSGKYDDAITAFNRVIELDPNNVKAINNLSISYYYAEQWEEAIYWNEKALEIAPSYQFYVNLATLYYYQKADYTAAAENYEKALQLNDKSYAVWGNLATAYYWSPGNRAEAIEAFRVAISKVEKSLKEFNESDQEALSELATYLVMVGDVEKSRAKIDEALVLAPQDNKVLMRKGFIEERLGNRDEALDWIERAIEEGYPVSNIEKDPGFAQLLTDTRYIKIKESPASQ